MPTAVTSTEPSPVLTELELQAWRALVAANAGLLRELDDELHERDDFTLGDYDVLINLSAAEGQRLRMCDLADAVLLSPSGLTRRVDRLERAGLVLRERATDDARNVEAGLTVAGQRLLRRVRATHHDGIKRRFADQFSEAELETLSELLGRLTPAD